jgi:hypothetical protein
MSAPLVSKQSEKTFQIDIADIKKVKQYAILSLHNRKYEVESMLPNNAKLINLSALGIEKQASTQYYLVAIGYQNQLSKLVAL